MTVVTRSGTSLTCTMLCYSDNSTEHIKVECLVFCSFQEFSRKYTFCCYSERINMANNRITFRLLTRKLEKEKKNEIWYELPTCDRWYLLYCM